ncbi:MAG TPA: hypothetical protein VFV02_13500 [Acidimicrobiales bacterium]|nr:hypothetical protein [Acidimicrobiales bacterium]
MARRLQPGGGPVPARRWFGLLDHLGLLTDDEAEVWRDYRDVLAGFEVEPVTRSYKLVTLETLVHDQTLRTGSSITRLARTAHRLVAADPRLVADTRSDTAMPDPVGADEATWRVFWRQWPLAAWAGELQDRPGRWFRIEEDRFVPTFRVPEPLGPTFDFMVAELVDWRLGRYLFSKGAESTPAMRLRVSQSNSRPLVWLDRARYADLPTGETPFVADGEEFVGHFVKIALNVARRAGSRANDLHDLLRGWFGSSAGQPGTEHYVELRRLPDRWLLQPSHDDLDHDQAAGGT